MLNWLSSLFKMPERRLKKRKPGPVKGSDENGN